MGGAFGGKEVQANAWAAIAALGAWKTRRPVRVRLTRELDMALTGKRHPFLVRYRGRPRVDGRIAAVRLRVLRRRRLEPRPLGADHVARAVPLRQRVPDLRRSKVTGRVCLTHKTSQTAFRGFGGPQACSPSRKYWPWRHSVSAFRPEVDPRTESLSRGRRHATTGRRVQSTPTASAIIWRALMASSGLDERRPRRSRRSTPGSITQSAASPSRRSSSASRSPPRSTTRPARCVLVFRDGTVQVNHGGTEMGQGLFTKMQQVAADGLGVLTPEHPPDADAHRQGPEHLGDRRVGEHRPQRCGGRGCLPADRRPADAGGRGDARVSARRPCTSRMAGRAAAAVR